MDDEYKALTATLTAFYTFHKWQTEHVIEPKAIKYASLSPEEKDLLPWYPNMLRDLGQCVELNRLFTESLALTAAGDWDVPAAPDQWAPCSNQEYDKVRSTLLQMAREWSSDGAEERKATFGRIVDALSALFPENREQTKVLVPGCGLGRLVLELVRSGFWTQGNEISYHMLLALGYILNRLPVAFGHTIFPYIHTLSHLARRLFQVRPLLVPDESPLALFGSSEAGDRMLMAAGSFIDLYGPPGLGFSEQYSSDESAAEFRTLNAASFDVVATCFFLDTASNVIDYLKTIHYCLKDNGVWVNVGPLLWHFDGDLSAETLKKVMEPGKPAVEVQSVMQGLELSREELFEVMDKIGFTIETAELGIETTYSSDVRALGGIKYDAEFWVARKRPVK